MNKRSLRIVTRLKKKSLTNSMKLKMMQKQSYILCFRYNDSNKLNTCHFFIRHRFLTTSFSCYFSSTSLLFSVYLYQFLCSWKWSSHNRCKHSGTKSFDIPNQHIIHQNFKPFQIWKRRSRHYDRAAVRKTTIRDPNVEDRINPQTRWIQIQNVSVCTNFSMN